MPKGMFHLQYLRILLNSFKEDIEECCKTDTMFFLYFFFHFLKFTKNACCCNFHKKFKQTMMAQSQGYIPFAMILVSTWFVIN